MSTIKSGTVTFDFSEFEDQVQGWKQEEAKKQQEELQSTAQLIATQGAFDPLPTQAPSSVLLHQAIVEKFQKQHGKSGKSEFLRRKSRRKQQRQQKKGSDHADKLRHKLTRKITQKIKKQKTSKKIRKKKNIKNSDT